MAERDTWQLGDFVRAHTSLSERTLAAYEADVRLFSEWVARAGIDSPSAVQRTLVRRYVASLTTRDFARRTIARKAAALRRYFGWAAGEGLVSADPTIGLQVRSGDGRLPRRVSVVSHDPLASDVDEARAAFLVKAQER